MTAQCKTCPWRAGARVADIPRYERAKHERLRDTIAEPGSLAGLGRGLKVMACHYSTEETPSPCAGWLNHQIGEGNNLALRLAAMSDARMRPEVDGPQRRSLAATLDEDDEDAL